MSLALARVRLRDKLDTVSGIGTTHRYMPLVSTEKGILDRLTKDGKLHAWCVTLAEDQPYSTDRKPSTHEHAIYHFNIVAFMAVGDAGSSEEAWQDLVERAIAVFRADKKLGGEPFFDMSPAQWTRGGYVMWAGVLCHFARLSLKVKEQTEPTA